MKKLLGIISILLVFGIVSTAHASFEFGTHWSGWSACTAVCGSSVGTQTRTCQFGGEGFQCALGSHQTRNCETTVVACPVVPNGYFNDGIGYPHNPPDVCVNHGVGEVANINVVQGVPDDTVLVQWSLPTGADKVHIIYGETSLGGWQHALLNTANDGNEEIHLLKKGVRYTFAVAGVSGCQVGKWSRSFTSLP